MLQKSFQLLISFWEGGNAKLSYHKKTVQQLNCKRRSTDTILDGFVIADEYRMSDLENELVMLGMNYRAYDTETNTWNMKWLEALSGTWLDLGPEELGGVQVTDYGIRYKAEFKPRELHRITFFDIAGHHFSWSVDLSKDGGDNWQKSVMVIEAQKSKNTRPS